MRPLSSILTVALCVTIIGCRKQPQTGVSVESNFRPLVPADTVALARIDWEKLKATPLYQRHQSELNFPLLNSAAERIGFDPRRDVSRLLIAWTSNQRLILAEGKFQSADMEKKVAGLGARVETYNKHQLINFGPNSVVFFKSLAIEGTTNMVRAAIDRNEKGRGEVPEDLHERLHNAPPSAQIWEVSRGFPFSFGGTGTSGVQSILSNITGYVQGTTLGVAVDTGVHLSADISGTSEQGAQRIRDTLRAAIAVGRLRTKDSQQDLLRIYDAFKIDQNQSVVQVRADLPADLSDKLFAMLPDMTRGSGQGLIPR